MHVDDYENKAAGANPAPTPAPRGPAAPPVPPPRPPPGGPKPGPPKVGFWIGGGEVEEQETEGSIAFLSTFEAWDDSLGG